MTLKHGAAIGALLAMFALSASAVPASLPGDAPEALRAAYRRPAAIPFPEDNPYTAAKADLGRALFFDPMLSGPRTRSCASCHVPSLSWSDGRQRASMLDDGEMGLRTPTLADVAWTQPLGWDGKFRTLEEVAFAPITAKSNMNLPMPELIARLSGSPRYVEAFARAFPDALTTPVALDPGGGAPAGPVTRERIGQALATFERMITARPAPFDRWIAGDETAIPAAAKRGFVLFNGKANCAACHNGPSFTDGSFHDIGSATGEDVGRGHLFPGSKALRHAFKTPTLREVAGRAPYMHDGSVTTLEAVIDLYDRGGIERPSRSPDIRPLNLSAAEKADLLAFLRTLDGDGETHPALGFLADAPYRP